MIHSGKKFKDTHFFLDELSTFTKKDWLTLKKATDKRRRELKTMHRIGAKMYRYASKKSARARRLKKQRERIGRGISKGYWKGFVKYGPGLKSIARMRSAALDITNRSRVVAAMIRVRSFGGAFYPLRYNRAMDLATAARFDYSAPLRCKGERATQYYLDRRRIS